jgi:glycogen synthase
MNLLHVSAGYAPFLGGAEVYVQAMSERLAGEGHSVTVVATDAGEVEYYWNPRKSHGAPDTEDLNGVRVVRHAVGHLPLSPWSFYGLRRFATLLARVPSSLPLLRWLARYMPSVPELEASLDRLDQPFDLVHAINISLEWPVIAAWRYARRHGLPFVVTPFVHVGEYHNAEVLINYVMPHQLEVLMDADAILVQTGIEADALAGLGVQRERLHRLGMGVDLNDLTGGDATRFRAAHSLPDRTVSPCPPLVAFLGVVTYDKGSYHLVRAIEKLWAEGVDVDLVIAGRSVDAFDRFFEGLNPETQRRIPRPGVVRGQQKQDLLAAADLLVLPSRIDSFGIVYLEAWAYGKPVIGAHAGGVPDVISNGEDGLLVKFGDVEALSKAIRMLVEDPQRARDMGARGRAKVEAVYTWDRICARLSEVYEQAMSTPRRPV